MTKKQEKKLGVADFNFKSIHERGGKMKMITPGGHDSGYSLVIRGPDCDESMQANRIYTRAILAAEDSLSDLRKQAEESGNWYEYKIAKEDLIFPANVNFACMIVTGWTLGDDFSEEALRELISNWPALIDQVSEFHAAAREKLDAK